MLKPLLLSLCLAGPAGAATVTPGLARLVGAHLPVSAPGLAGLAARNLEQVRLRNPDFGAGWGLRFASELEPRLAELRWEGAPLSEERLAAMPAERRERAVAALLEAHALALDREAEAIIAAHASRESRAGLILRYAERADAILVSPFFVSGREARSRLQTAYRHFDAKAELVRANRVENAVRATRRALGAAEDSPAQAPPMDASFESAAEAAELMALNAEKLDALPGGQRAALARHFRSLGAELQTLSGRTPRWERIDELALLARPFIERFRIAVRDLSGWPPLTRAGALRAAESLRRALEGLRDRLRGEQGGRVVHPELVRSAGTSVRQLLEDITVDARYKDFPGGVEPLRRELTALRDGLASAFRDGTTPSALRPLALQARELQSLYERHRAQRPDALERYARLHKIRGVASLLADLADL